MTLGLSFTTDVEVDTHPLGHTAPVAVENDVGLLDQLGKDLLALIGEGVDGDALFALGDADGRRLRHGHLEPDGIAGQRLDLDHPGAMVGEHGAAERPGVERAEVENSDAVQRWDPLGRCHDRDRLRPGLAGPQLGCARHRGVAWAGRRRRGFPTV